MAEKDSQNTSEKRKQRQDKANRLYGEVFITLANLKTYIEHADHSVKTADSPRIPSADPDRAKVLREEVLEALYYSFVILLYGVVEDRLRQICDLISETKKLRLHAKELNGDAISQCTTFLSKLADVPTDSIKSLPEIKDLAKVRNCIVHGSGFIERIHEKDRNRLMDLTKKHPDLISLRRDVIAGQDKLILNFEYCRTSLRHASLFFAEVFGSKPLAASKLLLRVYQDVFR